MQTKLMTEYEWRKKTCCAVRQRPSWWGPQCLFPSARRRRILHDRSFQRFLMLTSIAAALMLPLQMAVPVQEEFGDAVQEEVAQIGARRVSAISYAAPANLDYQTVTFTREELLRGKMLLLDESHLLPADAPPPNTVAIAKYGSGMVPVRSLSVKTGRETINALSEVFAQMKFKGAEGIYVWQGAATQVQQRRVMIEKIRTLMATYPPEASVQMAKTMLDAPGSGELLQEYAVDLRLLDSTSLLPDERALEETQQGQTLLQLAWRYGFVRSSMSHPYRFRYVGRAHAMAMTYLDLDLASYLEWMHQKKSMVISAGGKPQYLILCQPMDGTHIAFDLPAGCAYEASLDNTGYALVACTL